MVKDFVLKMDGQFRVVCRKIVITMDDDPFVLLENGYRKMYALDFLLNDNALEEI